MKPEAVVFAKFFPCFKLYNSTFLNPKMALDEIIVVYFAEEAYSLAVLAESVGHLYVNGYLSHLGFGQRAEGKHQV